jgi:enoyl-CoA hydratase/carnithine racemase
MSVELSLHDGVAVLALNRPEARNALNLEMCEGLLHHLSRLSEEVRLVFVRGNGPVFCGGADVKERTGKSEQWVASGRLKAFAAYEALERCRCPASRSVHGAAIGSGLRDRRRRATSSSPRRSAIFRTPEAQRGTVGADAAPAAHLGKRSRRT